MSKRTDKEAQINEHRHNPRLLAGFDVAITWKVDGKPCSVTGKCLDISSGGARIQASTVPPVSTLVYLKFLSDLNLEANGIVRYANEQGSIGIEFTQMTFCGSVIRHKPRPLFVKITIPVVIVAALGLVVYFAPHFGKFVHKWRPSPQAAARTISQTTPFFTLGSTKTTVQAVQGTPTSMTDSVWRYKLSRIYFRSDRVVGWSISPETPLKVGAPKPESTETKAGHYETGSTAMTVLAVEGSPTELTENVWRYGESEVYFRKGKVIGWKSSPSRPLKFKASR
ncbi:MAG: PilZ domain-containing protein [Bryobacteraceae bacterium]